MLVNKDNSCTVVYMYSLLCVFALQYSITRSSFISTGESQMRPKVAVPNWGPGPLDSRWTAFSSCLVRLGWTLTKTVCHCRARTKSQFDLPHRAPCLTCLVIFYLKAKGPKGHLHCSEVPTHLLRYCHWLCRH